MSMLRQDFEPSTQTVSITGGSKKLGKYELIQVIDWHRMQGFNKKTISNNKYVKKISIYAFNVI